MEYQKTQAPYDTASVEKAGELTSVSMEIREQVQMLNEGLGRLYDIVEKIKPFEPDTGYNTGLVETNMGLVGDLLGASNSLSTKIGFLNKITNHLKSLVN